MQCTEPSSDKDAHRGVDAFSPTRGQPGSSPVPPSAFPGSQSGYSVRSVEWKASPWGCRICSSCEKHKTLHFFRPISNDCLFFKRCQGLHDNLSNYRTLVFSLREELLSFTAERLGGLSGSVTRPRSPNLPHCTDCVLWLKLSGNDCLKCSHLLIILKNFFSLKQRKTGLGSFICGLCFPSMGLTDAKKKIRIIMVKRK